jgi:hypothetical protein
MIPHLRANPLLWILGGLLAGNAVSAPPATPDLAVPGSAALSSAPAAPSSAAAPARAATGDSRVPQVASVSRTTLPPGQVWQCVSDGERIFSDAPCGAHASIRQLRELNVMDAPPARSFYPNPFAPLSAPAPAFAPAPPDDSDYADPWGSDVIWARGYARRNYFSRQDSHIRPPSQAHPQSHRGRN